MIWDFFLAEVPLYAALRTAKNRQIAGDPQRFASLRASINHRGILPGPGGEGRHALYFSDNGARLELRPLASWGCCVEDIACDPPFPVNPVQHEHLLVVVRDYGVVLLDQFDGST